MAQGFAGVSFSPAKIRRTISGLRHCSTIVAN
jgi:hypothetical protein